MLDWIKLLGPPLKHPDFGDSKLTLSRHFSFEFALVAIVCATAIFFFPAVRGPYSVVHGPVTALRSLKTRPWIWLALALVTVRILGCHLSGYPQMLQVPPREGVIPRASLPENAAVLRC